MNWIKKHSDTGIALIPVAVALLFCGVNAAGFYILPQHNDLSSEESVFLLTNVTINVFFISAIVVAVGYVALRVMFSFIRKGRGTAPGGAGGE
jgi:hypothetical protein